MLFALIFCQSLNRLQRGLSAIAELLVTHLKRSAGFLTKQHVGKLKQTGAPMTDGPTSPPKLQQFCPLHAAVRTSPDSSKTLALYKSCTYLLTYLKLPPGKRAEEMCSVFNSSAVGCSISLKFGMLGAMRFRGGRRSVEFVCWCITGLAIKAQNDRRDVWPGSLKLQCIAITFLWDVSIFLTDSACLANKTRTKCHRICLTTP